MIGVLVSSVICSLVTTFNYPPSGEEVPAAEPSGPNEGEGSHGRGEEQTFCLPCGGEESRPHSEVGREIQRVYRQLLRTFRARWDLGKQLLNK